MLGLTAIGLLMICAFNINVFNAKEAAVHFDGAQLWRISNIKNTKLFPTLQNEYATNVSIKVLNSNIQELFDQERLRNSLTTFGALGSKWDSGINWTEYHDLEIIYEFLKDINKKYPNITTLYTIGETVEGWELKVLSISENPKIYKKIWIDGGIHAREWVSPAAVTYIMDQFLSNWQNQPKYIKQLTWYFMPVVNPDGYAYSRITNRRWRKNRATSNTSDCIGVDLNRNFHTGWKFAPENPCSEAYRGSSPGSELETKAIMKFLLKQKLNFKAFSSFHSYNQRIYYPPGFRKTKVKNAEELQDIGDKAAKRILKQTGKRFTSGQLSVIATHGVAGGTSLDWSYFELGAKYSFVIELRDTGKYGFLLPANQIIPSGLESLIFAKTVAESIN